MLRFAPFHFPTTHILVSLPNIHSTYYNQQQQHQVTAITHFHVRLPPFAKVRNYEPDYTCNSEQPVYYIMQ